MAKQFNPLAILAQQVQKNEQVQLIVEWGTIMGPLANLVTLERIEKGTVLLAIKHPALAQELDALRHVLLARMNQHLPTNKVQQIRIITASRKKMKNISSAARPARHQVATFSLPQSLQNVLHEMQDLELANALQQYFVRCANE